MTSNLGTTEPCESKDRPCAVTMGETVLKRRRPFIWIPDSKPFHVTNAKALRISCPLRYRDYADRVEANVPIWKERITLTHPTGAEAAPNFLSAAPSAPEVPSSVAEDEHAENLDENITVPHISCEWSPEDLEGDETVPTRSISKLALVLAAESEQHRLAHYPHNP